MTGMTNAKIPYYLTLCILLLAIPLQAQTDTLKHDRWIAWITPTSGLHFIHPAIEVGAEYSRGNLWAYTLSYGIRSREKKELHYEDQSHQYIRLGFKKYFVPKFNSGYIMPEMGIFHISHKGLPGNIEWREEGQPALKADARIHDYYLKAGALLGRKMKAGDLRFDIFIGGGARFTFRHHSLQQIREKTEGQEDYYEHHGLVMRYDYIPVDTPKGWRTLPPFYYLSLGMRLGIGLRPVKIPVENSLP